MPHLSFPDKHLLELGFYRDSSSEKSGHMHEMLTRLFIVKDARNYFDTNDETQFFVENSLFHELFEEAFEDQHPGALPYQTEGKFTVTINGDEPFKMYHFILGSTTKAYETSSNDRKKGNLDGKKEYIFEDLKLFEVNPLIIEYSHTNGKDIPDNFHLNSKHYFNDDKSPKQDVLKIRESSDPLKNPEFINQLKGKTSAYCLKELAINLMEFDEDYKKEMIESRSSPLK